MIKKFTYILIISLMNLPLQGTVSTWNFNGSGNWNDGTKWNTNPVFPNAIDDTANFLGVITAAASITLGQNITIGTVTFDDNNVYTILTGNTLTFSVSAGNAALSIPVTNTGAHIMACPVILNSNLTATLASGANFTLSGGISDAGGITKNGTGAGSLFLSGSGTYLGSTTVNTGNMTYNLDGCIPGSSAVLVGDGSGSTARITFQQDMTGNALATTLGSNGILSQSANIDVLLTSLSSASTTSSVILTGSATAGALFQVSGSTNTTFAGIISGGATSTSMSPIVGSRVTKAGTSILTLTGNSTYVSRTFIENGVILAQSNNALGGSGNNSGVFVRDTTPTLGTLGTLRIDNNITLSKRILINGTGFSGEGAIHNVGGSNTISSSGALVIGWSFTGQETASDPTIQVDNGTSLTVAGIVSGARDLTKSGLGTLTYSGTAANTQTGLTIISQGLVQFNKTAGINATAGSVTINNGGTLQLQAANQIINTRDITINTGGTFDMGSNVETINALNFNGGSITNSALLTIASNSFGLNLGDGVSVPGPIAFTTTNGGISYVGSTTQSNILGTVDLGTLAQAWSVNSGPAVSVDISGVISNTAPITKSGAGTIQISGSSPNTTQTGTITISAGTLALNKDDNLAAVSGTVVASAGTLLLNKNNQFGAASTVTISGGTFDMNSKNASLSSMLFTGGTFTQGTGVLTLTTNVSPALSMGGASPTTINGALVFTGTGSIFFSNSAGLATINGDINLGSNTRDLNISNNASLTVEMMLNGALSGLGGLNKLGTGVAQMGGTTPNTYSGLTSIQAGTLMLGKTANVVALAGDVTIQGGTLQLLADEQIKNTSLMTLSSGTWNQGTFSTTVQKFNFTGGTFTVSGNPNLTLLSNDTTTPNLTIGASSTVGANLILTGAGNVSATHASGTVTLSGAIDLGGLTHTFNVETVGTTLAMSGAISNGAFTKIGAGNLTMSGAANTYTGTTTVSAGTLTLNKASGTTSINGNIDITGGTLSITNPNQIVDTSVVNLTSGSLNLNSNAETISKLTIATGATLTGTGTLTLAGANPSFVLGDNMTISTPLTFSAAGGIQYTGTTTASTISGAVNVGATGITFDVAPLGSSVALTVSSVISNATGAVTKSTGTGVLQFSGGSANTYGGLTTISAGTLLLNKTTGNAIAGNVDITTGGTLKLNAANQIANASTVNINGGSFDLNGNAETITNLNFASGTFTQGAGILTLSGAVAPSLTMGNGTTIPGSIVFSSTGGITYSGVLGGTIAGDVNSGTTTLAYNITDQLEITGTLTSTGGVLNKITGTGTLRLSGSSPNNFAGSIILSSGTIKLNKSGGAAFLGTGSINVNAGGTLILEQNQVATSATVALAGGIFDMNSKDLSAGIFNCTSGTLLNPAPTITLSSNTTAMTLTGFTLPSNIVLTGTGGLTLSTCTLSGNLDLGASSHSITLSTNSVISGVISGVGGGYTRNGTAGAVLQITGSGPNTYTGTTAVSSGTLTLAKDPNVIAVPGDINITNANGTLLLANPGQIATTSTITQTAGTWNLAGFNTTLLQYTYNGGTYTSGGAVLTLTSNVTALQIAGNTTLTADLVLSGTGSIVKNSASSTNTIVGSINLNGNTHSIMVTNAPSTINITGTISNGAITKTGLGTVNFNGSANTYTGLTTVSAGTLILNKSANTTAVAGDLFVNGGTLNFGNNGQLATTTTLTLDSGSISLAGFTETLSSLVLNGGTLSNSGGTFNLSSAVTALSMRDMTLGENLNISGGGDIIFDATNNGTATISGNVNLDFITPFDIARGTANEDMLVSGPIIGAGGIFKTGTGILRITGANAYTNTTTISQGTLIGTTDSLIGSIIDEGILTFDQSFDGTFSGAITGVTGSLIKQGTGSVTLTNANFLPGLINLSEGTLVVNGSINGGGSFVVESNGTLKGTGTINKNVTLSGTLKPGNSIGTIHLVGDQVFASGSNLEIDLNLTSSDLVDITGSLTIEPGSIVTLVADPVDYPDLFHYTIIQTTGGVTGTFDQLVNTWFLFEGVLAYTPNSVILRGLFLPFTRFVHTGNAGGVACCLDRVPYVKGTDIANIIDELYFIFTVEELQYALNQLQPSLYTGMTIAAQDDLWYLKNAIYNHLDENYACCLEPGCYSVWATVLGADTKQKSRCDIGFHNHSYGALVGVDTYAIKPVRLGAGLGYTHDNLHWKWKRGKGRNNTFYGLLYGDWKCQMLTFQGILSGAFNWYSLTRNIQFTGLNTVCRTAHGKPRGMEFFASIRGELLFNTWPVNIYPYINLDYYYLKRDSFQESGAGSISLRFTNYHADLLITEGGIQFSRSFCCSLTPYFNISVINENRFRGDKQTSYIICCPFITEGLYPSRTLLGLGAGLNYSINSCYEISAYYKGRYGHSFKDNSFYLSLRMNK